jgi:hypothetical protein
MRLPIILLVCSVAGILGGGALISVAALGGCLIFCSLAAGAWALLHDDGTGSRPGVHEVPTLNQVLERARAS